MSGPLIVVEMKASRLGKWVVVGYTLFCSFYVLANVMIFHAVNTTARQVAAELSNFEAIEFPEQLEVMHAAMTAAESHWIYDWVDPFGVLILWIGLLIIWFATRLVIKEINISSTEKKQLEVDF
ncbi:hypothetical protein [Algimonas porphyrae]|nr:hypothetical protein [Algimonas porphyrae]